MKDERKQLPIFYQNMNTKDNNHKSNNESKLDHLKMEIPVLQTKYHKPEIFYKAISKIWLNEA